MQLYLNLKCEIYYTLMEHQLAFWARESRRKESLQTAQNYHLKYRDYTNLKI